MRSLFDVDMISFSRLSTPRRDSIWLNGIRTILRTPLNSEELFAIKPTWDQLFVLVIDIALLEVKLQLHLAIFRWECSH